ncbi:hypothetical protein BGZ72_000128 [Mortierella alpina]|nr:hypothetical protein BGZ72_000128 [Mortierella alpina]
MSTTILIYCLVDGEAQSRAFPIRIDSADSIGDLKELIKAKKTPRFNDVAADELTLWQVSVPVNDDEDESLIFLDALTEKKKAFPTKLLSDLFDEIPKDTIHVIVQKPQTEALDQLYLELANRVDTTPSLLLDDEDMCTYVAPILHHAAGLSKDKLKVRYKPRFDGSRGRGQADFSIDMKGVSLTDRTTQVIVTKVKNKDFKSAVAQNMVLLESTLSQQQAESRKRKRDDQDDDNNDNACSGPLVCHGIVTDAHFWYFVECRFETTAKSPLHYAKFRVCDLKSNTVFQKSQLKSNNMKNTFASIAGLLTTVVDNKRKRTKSE